VRTTGFVLMCAVLCGLFLTPLSGCAFNGKQQVGPAADNPGVYYERTIFSARAAFTTQGQASADRIAFNKKTGELSIDRPQFTSDPVPVMDAQTKKIVEALVPMSKEHTAWTKQTGENIAMTLNAMSALATSILDGLPAGQIKQAVVALIQAIDNDKAAVAATQPAKSEPPTEPTQ
jgi:hypothetical protein